MFYHYVSIITNHWEDRIAIISFMKKEQFRQVNSLVNIKLEIYIVFP